MNNCWDIKQCGRGKGGSRVKELGECVASVEGLGHSCWAIAGTLGGGEVQGRVARKESNCMACEVHKRYHRATGSQGKEVAMQHPGEQKRYNAVMLAGIKAA